jgi:uncharacterized repeat protein (TIGR03803 family)
MPLKHALAVALLGSLAGCGAGGTALSLPNSSQATSRTTSSYAVVYNFRGPPSDGYVPMGGLVSDGSGHLYGITAYGSGNLQTCSGGCGTFFSFDPSSRRETVLYSFGRTRRDAQSYPNFILFHDGSFYGTTQNGGKHDSGTVFKITPPASASGTWNEAIIYRFRGPPRDGSYPSQIIIDASGTIYGAAGAGGPSQKCTLGCGNVFMLRPPPAGNGEWRETVLHEFAGAPDGAGPSSLTLAPNGTLYGETNTGGPSSACGNNKGCGTVFALAPSRHGSGWALSIVHAFRTAKGPKNDGEVPEGGLTLTSSGTLYGVTAYGGPQTRCYIHGYDWSGCGTFFLLKPTASGDRTRWTESILYLFKGAPADARAPDNLTFEGRGFYGTSAFGGQGYCNRYWGCGTLFHLSPPRRDSHWSETMVHSLGGGRSDGWDPGGPVIDEGKDFYGVTMYGGAYCTFGCGTIYEFRP